MKLRIGKKAYRVGKKFRRWLREELEAGRLPKSVLDRGASVKDIEKIVMKGRRKEE